MPFCNREYYDMTRHYGVKQSNLIACFVVINDPHEKDSPSAHQSNTSSNRTS
ncbi:Protein CBG20353 [Caenorhabditis briggsae]|uniref:Protein CBG20353 n=1 Tax=Caenorhabditis briggsae TaxID=6238 RepID=A8XXL8_CAEBR|nr:Protein CBG20353 [Caenorhabditis briggsae]CAP37387.1 Protein CBG20353 [Caenorhabditis briggsae]